MLFGIAVLPAGRRRNTLTRALDGLLELFGDRVLPFDTDAARNHAALAVAARTLAAARIPLTSPSSPHPRTAARR